MTFSLNEHLGMCVFLTSLCFQELSTGRGKARPFFRALTFREKWKGGRWVPVHLLKGDKANLLPQREHTWGSSGHWEEEVERKSLLGIYLLAT